MLKLIPVDDIKISPNRQRREFKQAELNELAESIKQRSLFHAIVLRRQADDWILVSGERRLRAIKDIYELGGEFKHSNQPVPTGMIPFVTLGDLSPLDAEEAELEENIRRIDLTWQERAAADARLANLRTKQAKEKGEPVPSVADISIELRGSKEGIHQETVRRELIVARHLDDPEVKAAKGLDEAFKLLKRKEEARKNVELAEQVGRTFSVASHQVIHTDSLIWLAKAADEMFDVIVTDPPFGMGSDEFGDSNGVGGSLGGHGYKDDADYYNLILATCVEHFIRITKLQAHLYWFCDIDKFHQTREAFSAAGWWVFRTPLIYYKPNGSRAPWPEHGPQRKYELILYAVKGKKPVTKLYGDVIACQPDPQMGNAAQKPVAIYEELLRRSAHPGDFVMDCFAGTGSILPAAHALKCKATAIEKDPVQYGNCLKRLEKLKEQKELAL